MKMHKLFLILSFTLLLAAKFFGQAQVDIQFTMYDGNAVFDWTRVGLDTTATLGIDPQLGEYDIPPIPPTGMLLAAFDLTPYIGSPISTFRDYRNAPSFPYTGSKEHTLKWQIGNGGSFFTIFYDFPAGVMANIKDPVGGIFYNENLSDSGSFTIPTNIFYTSILTMYYDNVIPVELIAFTASVLQNEKAIQLNWTTATETNNSGFKVERASSGTSPGQAIWNTIGFVPGFGTTTEPKSYSFVDDNVTTGIYKYRLKQIDLDGSFEYFNEIEVEVDFTPEKFVLYQNYPNPFNPTTIIKFTVPSVIASEAMQSQLVTLKVYDVLGNEVATLVNEEKQPGVYEVQFDASSLASGMYLYKLQTGSFVQTNKMILLR